MGQTLFSILQSRRRERLITQMLKWAKNSLISPRSPAILTVESSSLRYTQPLVVVG